LTPERWNEAKRIWEDPIDHYRRLERELKAHPHYGPQLERPGKFEMPKATLRSEDGREVYDVGQLQQIRDYDQQQFSAQFAQQAQEIESLKAYLQQREMQQTQASRAEQTSSAIMADLRALPNFSDVEKDIAKELSDHPEVIQQLGVQAAAYRAYVIAFKAKVLPKLKQAEKQDTLSTLQKKAAAGTVDPSQSGAAADKRPKNAKELAKVMKTMAGVG